MTGKILVVEDDQDFAKILSRNLMKHGYTVSFTHDALSGISQAHKFKPDVILLDLLLPAGGGITLLEAIASSVNTNLIPVIVMTGSQDDELLEKVKNLGVTEVLLKPFDF